MKKVFLLLLLAVLAMPISAQESFPDAQGNQISIEGFDSIKITCINDSILVRVMYQAIEGHYIGCKVRVEVCASTGEVALKYKLKMKAQVHDLNNLYIDKTCPLYYRRRARWLINSLRNGYGTIRLRIPTSSGDLLMIIPCARNKNYTQILNQNT